MEQVCRKTGNNKMNKIAAFAIFGPLHIGSQHLDHCVSDFNRYMLDFNHCARVGFQPLRVGFQSLRVGFRPLSIESIKKHSFSA
jgi:hypothetical protein